MTTNQRMDYGEALIVLLLISTANNLVYEIAHLIVHKAYLP